MAGLRPRRLHRIGDYDIDLLNIIGSGSFGQVYKGEDGIGKTVAAKNVTYMKDGDIEQQCLQMTETELAIFRKLEGHNNIVKLLHCFDDKISLWLIIEYCDLGDLYRYVKKNPPNKIAKLKIMYECSSAIAFMHSFNPPVVHRDIKPSNILMMRQENQDVAKLTDFGMGKLFEPSAGIIHLTMKSMKGTYSFMAPEFYSAENPIYQPGVDIFALGLVFHCLLFCCEDNVRLEPISAVSKRSNTFIHFGLEMANAVKQNEQMPVLYVPAFEDDPTLNQVQTTINAMVQFHERNRTKPQEVKDKLVDVYFHALWEENCRTKERNLHTFSLLQHKERELKTTNTKVSEKEICLHQKERKIQTKNIMLAKQEKELQKINTIVLEKEMEMAQKEEIIHTYKQKLQQKIQQVQERGGMILLKESELKRKDEQIKSQEKKLEESHQENETNMRRMGYYKQELLIKDSHIMELERNMKEMDRCLQDQLADTRKHEIEDWTVDLDFGDPTVDLESFSGGGRRMKLSYNNVLKNLETLNNEKDVFTFTGLCYRFSVVNGSLWIPVWGTKSIHIVSIDGEKISEIKYPDKTPNSVQQASEGEIILAANEGLFVLNEKCVVKYKIADGFITDISVDNNIIVAYDYNTNSISVYKHVNTTRMPRWKKTQTFIAQNRKRNIYITVLLCGETIYVCSGGSNGICTYNLAGEYLQKSYLSCDHTGLLLSGINKADCLLICSPDDNCFNVVTPQELHMQYTLERLSNINDIVMDSAGNTWVLSSQDDVHEECKFTITRYLAE